MSRPTFRRAAPLALIVFAAACGSDAVEYDAKAPDVPYINQLSPAGKDSEYDGSMNCGPALLAGIAKEHGLTEGYTDAAVVMLLADVAGTNDEGTTGHGMIAALEWMGFATDASAGGDLGWIDDELAAGHDVIANGDYWEVPEHSDRSKSAGHYIAITGVYNDWTTYEVTDPMSSKVTSMEDWELENFIESHPQGGFTISAW